MPFFNVSAAGADSFKRTVGMPRPLNVAILDKAQERERRTTAVLVDPFGYRDETERLVIEVPQTFLTDFASIPGWARAVISPFGRHAKAAVLHDWLYAIGEPGLKDTADRVFRNAMTELEVDGWAKTLMYNAVKFGGGGGFSHAARDWPTTFADVLTGATLTPPFERTEAFVASPMAPNGSAPPEPRVSR